MREDLIRDEVRKLYARGNVTWEEWQTLRLNSWEFDYLIPALTDEALLNNLEKNILPNCTRTEKYRQIVVKDVIRTKQEENRAALARRQRAEERRKILDILAAKKDEKLSQASIEELEKKLSELDV